MATGDPKLTRTANEIDRRIGKRLRERRRELGLSQEKLADALGITFQQVQKYEKGTNRISASRLFQLLPILQMSAQALISDVLGEEQSAAEDAEAAL